MCEIYLLKINDMTNNSVFALECLFDHNIQKFRDNIKDGIELCSMIEKGEHIDDGVISYHDLKIWEFMQLMKRFFNPEELSEITKEAIKIKSRIDYALTKAVYIDDFFSISEIREYQHFFNRVGSPFLRLATTKLRRVL